MNKTVERIVALLFQDLEETEEVRAIREELMNNCQERFEDLMSRGMSEDDAIGAVVESLKGMDEMLAAYPRKDNVSSGTYGAGVSFIHSQMKGWDLELQPSPDGRVNVQCNGERADLIDIRFDGSTLRLLEKNPSDNVDTSSMEANAKRFGEDLNWDSFTDLVRDFGAMFKRAMNNAGMLSHGTVLVSAPPQVIEVTHASASGNLIIHELPLTKLEASTVSGDVNVHCTSSAMEHVKVNSSSGDIHIDCDGLVECMMVNSTSGDVRLSLAANSARITTTSGDIGFTGNWSSLDINTISGDMELSGKSGQFDSTSIKSVSGDVDMTFDENCALHLISVKTTSGDASIVLPRNENSVHVTMKAISGDTDNRVGDAGLDARVQVRMETISGDLTIQ